MGKTQVKAGFPHPLIQPSAVFPVIKQTSRAPAMTAVTHRWIRTVSRSRILTHCSKTTSNDAVRAGVIQK